MFDHLATTIAEAGEEDILSAFGGDEESDGKGKKTAKKDSTEPKSKKTEKTTSSKEKSVLSSNKDVIPDFSDDDNDIFQTDDDDDDDSEEVKEKDKKADKKKEEKKDKKKEKLVEEDEEDADEDETDETEDEEEVEDTDKDEEDDEELDEEAQVKDFLKARVDLLIKKGEWADFEGREDVEWDEDTFADMELQQRQHAKTQMAEEILDSFGPYGREIASYVANGGDPDELIDIFKEQQRVESLSLDSEEDQRAVVFKYETEFLNRKPERAKKLIDGLIADKELASYAEEVKEKMEESLTEQRRQIQAEQEAAITKKKQDQIKSIKKFQSDVSGLVNGMTDIDADEKKQLLTVLTKFDKSLKNGTPVNEFYFKFDQFRKDLPNYIKLVRFVLNPQKFEKSIENKGKNAATEKAFKLARTATKTNKAKSASTANSGKQVKTKFTLL